MAAPIKRAVQAPPPVVEGLNFGEDSFYAAGGGLPEGDYVWAQLQVQMYQATTQQGVARGPQRLGVMIDMLPLDDPKPENVHKQFYSMGSKAHESFMPNEAGTGIVAIPNAKGSQANDQTNWNILRRSLYDCSLPAGIFTNDVSALAGIWVHMANVPEPEGRKGFVSQTSEAAGDQPNRPGTIAIVQEIKEDGKPWEGTGGIPEIKAAAKPNGKAVVKTTPAVAPKVAPKAAPATAPAAAATEIDVESVAQECVYEVLMKKPTGCPRTILKNDTFKTVKAKYDEDTASAVIEAYFGGDDELNSCLNQLNFGLDGNMVKPLAAE